ncbi:hypothetical protein [Fluviicola sp.]|uniref:hypothetical protein n=1 Tax=Fluviicola sp. TaxID=1917219 RepID=UPI00261CAB1F|nr:hypothetical protein [Fluviicola sp.]
MKSEIKYVELKSGHSGPAWIGLISYSKSGKTIYFDGKAFQRIGSDRILGNYYDIESGKEYWISGVKKDMSDRHRFGSGKVMVEERIVAEYLKIIKKETLDKSRFEIVSVNQEIPIERIRQLENEKFEDDESFENSRFKAPGELTNDELDFCIDYYEEESIHGKYLKNRKLFRTKMDELILEKNKRAQKESIS